MAFSNPPARFIVIFTNYLFVKTMKRTMIIMLALAAFDLASAQVEADTIVENIFESDTISGSVADLSIATEEIVPDSAAIVIERPMLVEPLPKPLKSIYAMPYSMTGTCYDWKRLWINSGVLGGAYVGALLVLECLPEDATSWNRAAIQSVPLGQRWVNHVLKEGPEWDADNPIFNCVLHPYAGAAYFMAARSNGFNFYQSLLYSTLVSTVGWEFGIEAFMERPSYQDLFITPMLGSVLGEGFYRIKRYIVDNGYTLAGSRFLGGLVCFLVDPVNEVIGLFAGNPARAVAKANISVQPVISSSYKGITLVANF